MSLRIVHGKTYPIGVDLGTTAVKMAQLADQNNTLTLTASATEPLNVPVDSPLSARLTAHGTAIRKLLRSGAFKSTRSVLGIPACDTHIEHVRLPRIAPEDQPAALRDELAAKLPFPIESAIIRHVVVGECTVGSDTKLEVLAAAASGRCVEQYLAMAAKAKLDVVAVNIEACAVVECFSRLFRRAADQNRSVLFMDIGSVSTQVVMAQGNRIRFARNLTVASRDLDQAVADALQVPPEEAHALRVDAAAAGEGSEAANEVYQLLNEPLAKLADEVTQCLRYCDSVFRNPGIERAIFVGGGAHDKRFCQSLAQQLNLPGQIGDPLIRIRRLPQEPRAEIAPEPAWAVAIGLSLGVDIDGKAAA